MTRTEALRILRTPRPVPATPDLVLDRAITITDLEICEEVAAHLKALDYDAYAEHTGGGIFCVFIRDPRFPGEEWIFGMADVRWAGARIAVDGYEPVEGTEVNTGVESDETDPDLIRKVATDIDAVLRNI